MLSMLWNTHTFTQRHYQQGLKICRLWKTLTSSTDKNKRRIGDHHQRLLGAKLA